MAAMRANTVPAINQKIAEVMKKSEEVRRDASISLNSARMDASGDEYGFNDDKFCGAWLIFYIVVPGNS
jgi:hypothetical protein